MKLTSSVFTNFFTAFWKRKQNQIDPKRLHEIFDKLLNENEIDL